mgnify:CR=1 FL=1
MALSKKPVNGMKDILPAEMEIRDYVTSVIKDTYRSFGFTPIETPCMENIANLTSKQGGENEKLIFKVMKRGEKLNLETAKEESDVVDFGMRYDLTVPLQDIIQTMPTTCHRRLRHFRWAMCGEQTDLREVATDSLHSVI